MTNACLPNNLSMNVAEIYSFVHITFFCHLIGDSKLPVTVDVNVRVNDCLLVTALW